MKVVIDIVLKSGVARQIIAESESTKQALEDLYSMQLEPVDGGAYSIEENEIAFVYVKPYKEIDYLVGLKNLIKKEDDKSALPPEEDQQDNDWKFTGNCYP